MMSTPPSDPPPGSSPVIRETREVKVVSHSTLFYWWPVWAVGFLMALLTWIDGSRMVVVPKGTESVRGFDAERQGLRDIVILPSGKPLPDRDVPEPRRHMSSTPSHAVIYVLTLLLVILITNVPLRGMWSVVVIITVVLLSIIFWLANWWEKIFEVFSMLDVRINMGGYIFISLALLAIWLITIFLFDRQTYMIFTPGQLRVCTAIGGGEKSYDTMGMTLNKQRSDLFRHWILGLGSGDLLVNTSGAQVEHFDWPNVLFVGSKVQKIDKLLREKAIVEGR
jgi:hypothetical protein